MNTRKDIELENVLDEEIYFTELPEEDKQLFCRYIRKTKLFGIFSLDSICTIPYNEACSMKSERRIDYEINIYRTDD